MERPIINELTDAEAKGLLADLTELFKQAGSNVAYEERAYIALAALTPRLFALFPDEYESVRFSCDCGSALVIKLGYPIPNRHLLLTFLIDHGHAPHKRGIAIRRVER